jgi:hypothetical protein
MDAAFVSNESQKIVTEETIVSGYCKKCRRHRSRKPISKIPVTL